MEHRGEPSRPAKDRPSVIYKDLPLIELAALTFLVDQVTKFLVQKALFFGESFPREGFLRISHTHNTGSAFGLFQGQNTPLIIVAFVGMTLFASWLASPKRRLDNILRFLMFALAAGAIGIISSFAGVPLKGYKDPISSLIAGGILVAVAAVAITWRTLALRSAGRQ